MSKVTEADKAYLAGLFEGEGTVYCSVQKHYTSNSGVKRERKTPTAQMHLVIAMTDLEPLKLVLYKWIHLESIRILGPYKPSNGSKVHWKLTVTSCEDILELWEAMSPWLSPRRLEQFESAHYTWLSNPAARKAA